MECPWNGVFHMDSMDWSMWIPWNSVEFPMDLHLDSMEFHGTIICGVKNSADIKNRTLDFATRHVRNEENVLTASLYDRSKQGN